MNNTNVSQKTRQTVITGMMLALTLILVLTPIGFIQIPPVSITIMHLPVIIAGIVGGPIAGLITGLGMGLGSIFRAMTSANPVDKLFLNPLISVLPRIFIGVISYYVYNGMRRLLGNGGTKFKNTIIAGVAAVAGTLTNTIGVLTMLYVIHGKEILEQVGVGATFKAVLAAVLSINVGLELVVAVLVCVPVIVAVKSIYIDR